MSFYNVAAFVEGRPFDIGEVSRILADHITLLFVEDVGVVPIYKKYDLVDGDTISIPFGRMVKLHDSEKKIIKEIGETIYLENHLQEIFADRFKSVNARPGEFDDWLQESVPYVSTLDLLSSAFDSEITVCGTIVASKGLCFGYSVQLPDSGCEIIQKFTATQDDEGLKLKEIAHLVSIELQESCWSGHYQFDFERMQCLFGSLIDQVDANTRIPISWVPVKARQEDYSYELQVRGIEKTLNVDFKYKGPESKRLRAEKHFRLHASVKEDGHELWSGFDPVELKSHLNHWCTTELQVCLDQMGFPSVSISDEQMQQWELEVSNAEKELPEDEHPNYPKELTRIARPLAENGNAVAQCAIGVSYMEREDGEQDMGKAIEWFRLSSGNGFAEAARNLHKVFSLGLGGVEEDPASAKKWAAFAKALDAM